MNCIKLEVAVQHLHSSSICSFLSHFFEDLPGRVSAAMSRRKSGVPSILHPLDITYTCVPNSPYSDLDAGPSEPHPEPEPYDYHMLDTPILFMFWGALSTCIENTCPSFFLPQIATRSFPSVYDQLSVFPSQRFWTFLIFMNRILHIYRQQRAFQAAG